MSTRLQLSQEQTLFLEDEAQYKALLAVAGAGKTTTIKALLNNQTSKRKLVIVYNVNLREQLKEEFKEYPNITVTNIHSLLYKWFKRYFNLEHLEIVEQQVLNSIAPVKPVPMNRSQFLEYVQRLLNRKPPIISYDILEGALYHDIIPREFVEKYNLIIIDEVQDIPVQLLKNLIKLFNNKQIIVAGDIYQTIYSFKGITPHDLLDILYTVGFRIFRLSTSFRAPNVIVPVINKLLDTPFKTASITKEGLLTRFIYKNHRQFFRNLFHRLRGLIQPELNYASKHWSAPIMEALVNHQTLAILTRVNNSAQTICNIAQKYGIPILCIPTMQNKVRTLVDLIQLSYLELTYDIKTHRDSALYKLQERLKNHEYKILFTELLKQADINGYDIDTSSRPELVNIITKYPIYILTEHARNLVHTLLKHNQQSIFVSTIHGAKGLEFDNVLLPDLNIPLFPLKDAPLEEEKRLLYVGLTRAKYGIFIAHSQTNASPFVSYFRHVPEIPTWEETPIQRTLI